MYRFFIWSESERIETTTTIITRGDMEVTGFVGGWDKDKYLCYSLATGQVIVFNRKFGRILKMRV